jgi:hypothetical protein
VIVQYVGRKTVNWPAVVLILGSVLVGLLLTGDFKREVSLFPAALFEPPLYWWPELSFVGFASVVVPMALGVLSLWLMPRVQWLSKAGGALIALGVVSLVFGIAWEAKSGVAIYSDRSLHRDPGFNSPLKTYYFTEITHLQTACVFERRRRSYTRTPNVDYQVHFADGQMLRPSWTDGFFWEDRRYDEKLKATLAINEAANRAGARRAPRRDVEGRLLHEADCIQLLAEKISVQPQDVADLFVVHQSELRNGEYVVTQDMS